MTAPFTELVKPLDDIVMLCRGCLAVSGEMKNMYEWGFAYEYGRLAGVKMEKSEPISQLLCTSCENMMNKCKRFKAQCEESDRLLKEKARTKMLQEAAAAEAAEALSLERDLGIVTSCLMYDHRLVVMITAADCLSKIYLPCPYQCTQRFLKRHDLFTHLVKTHQQDEKTYSIELQYYCSYESCQYHTLSKKNKWFSGRKFLNQHYKKVHKGKKIFTCNVCERKFATGTEFNSHLKSCNMTFQCPVCTNNYNTNEKLLVHLMRRHPEAHKQYKDEKKANKRKAKIDGEANKIRSDSEKLPKYTCDSPKRSSATQTLKLQENIKNDVSLIPWNSLPGKSDYSDAKTDEISTQTVFEDLLSIKSQTSEDDSIFFSETVSLSDIQTQTFPLEFGLSRSNKETITSETQSPDLSIKETQTCFCLYDSPKPNYRLFESISSSPSSINLTSTETQTLEMRANVKSDVLLNFNSTETQTYLEDMSEDI